MKEETVHLIQDSNERNAILRKLYREALREQVRFIFLTWQVDKVQEHLRTACISHAHSLADTRYACKY